ncbi:hypothetical protein EIP86_000473 [Pleurotus ostreatoroseus]|nr:hypothetical protein EIP86_000473 [Pleurotus ostreatoroseus]
MPRLALNLSTSTVHVSDQKAYVNVHVRDLLFVVAANVILSVCWDYGYGSSYAKGYVDFFASYLDRDRGLQDGIDFDEKLVVATMTVGDVD